MKLSSLRLFLDGKLSSRDLGQEFAADLADYEAGLSKLGGVVPIPVTEDLDIWIERRDIAELCRAFQRGELRATQLSLIADTLQLSESVDFSDPWVADAIAEMTDPEIQGEFTASRAGELIAAAGS